MKSKYQITVLGGMRSRKVGKELPVAFVGAWKEEFRFAGEFWEIKTPT